MPHDVRSMATEIGPDGQPPKFNGSAWVSQDGRWIWNGVAWQPYVRRRLPPTPALIGLVIAVLVVAGFFAYKALKPATPYEKAPPPATPYEGAGVTNGKIDSPTQIEFDYSRSSYCKNVVFEYKFYDSRGALVDDLADSGGSPVDANTTYHFVIKSNPGDQPIDSRAVRFEAVATCTQ